MHRWPAGRVALRVAGAGVSGPACCSSREALPDVRARPGRTLALSAVTVAATPWPAHAHLVDTGFGAFYDGALHLLATPEDLLPVVALTVLAGLRGAAVGRAVMLALPLAWLAGVAVGQAWSWPWPGAVTTAVTTVAFGGLTAANSSLRRGWVIALSVALGLVHGALNGAVLAEAGLGMRAGAGVACTVLVVVSVGSALIVTLTAPWTRVAARVAGSWIAATGLLMLGWGFRP